MGEIAEIPPFLSKDQGHKKKEVNFVRQVCL